MGKSCRKDAFVFFLENDSKFVVSKRASKLCPIGRGSQACRGKEGRNTAACYCDSMSHND
jgi:hypothetical protein